jgi:NAD(P)-dependent dehydrogenase (short-subunit alcohol dehydrogenase family)
MKESEGPAMAESMREVPIARLGRLEEIAFAVLFLCSPGAAYIIRHAFVVDGGYTIH